MTTTKQIHKVASKQAKPAKPQVSPLATVPDLVRASILHDTLAQWSGRAGKTLVTIEDYNTGYTAAVYLSTLKAYTKLFRKDNPLLTLHVVEEALVVGAECWGWQYSRWTKTLVKGVVEVIYPGGVSHFLPQKSGDVLYTLELT